MAPTKVTTAKEAVALLADEAESLGADANDSRGIVREIVRGALPDRKAVWFAVWFSVCCELADRAARLQGFDNEVHRALTVAKGNIAARGAAEVITC